MQIAKYRQLIIKSTIANKYLLLTSLFVSALVFGIRSLGVLTDGELSLYDRFVQWQPPEPPDPRILIVGIEEKDLTSLGKNDLVLSKLINKLDRYQPQSIGLDIYRDIPQEPGNIELTADLQANNKIVTICGNSEPVGVAPPPNVPDNRIGFADLAIDGHQTVRRNLLSMTPNADSKCHAGRSFGLVLAFNYLSSQGIKIPDRSNGNNDLQIGSTIFKPIENNFGGYQNLGKNANGYQILLKYRFPKVAKQVTMSQVLNGELTPDLVKNRIVLIGYTAESSKDFFYTPYSVGTPPETMPGVVVHAQAISQILSTVLDGRSQIWVWSSVAEFIWILGWTTTAALLFRFVSRPLFLIASVSGLTISVLGFYYAIFICSAGWLPLLPTLLSIVTIAAISSSYKLYLYLLIKNAKVSIKEPEIDKFLLKGRYKIIAGENKLITEENELQAGIAKGGFGIVYKAHDLHMPGKPLCAVKKLHSHFDPILLKLAEELFFREAETLYKLDHPQIPRLLAYFCEGGEFYLIEEFIKGETLRSVLNSQGQQSEDVVISWLVDVLIILEYIHNTNKDIDNAGVIHRDIKPENLILQKSDRKLFLIDFGAVKILEGFNEITIAHQPTPQPGTIITSKGYSPPEQFRGNAYPSSDIYSLGIVAIEALTGIYPQAFEYDDNNRISWRNNARVREDLAAIIDKMIQPLPIDRYQSAQEVIDSLSLLPPSPTPPRVD
jgi:CHASE2 domain-containing sensor protein/predicted Ser/Thr protein kinase